MLYNLTSSIVQSSRHLSSCPVIIGIGIVIVTVVALGQKLPGSWNTAATRHGVRLTSRIIPTTVKVRFFRFPLNFRGEPIPVAIFFRRYAGVSDPETEPLTPPLFWFFFPYQTHYQLTAGGTPVRRKGKQNGERTNRLIIGTPRENKNLGTVKPFFYLTPFSRKQKKIKKE